MRSLAWLVLALSVTSACNKKKETEGSGSGTASGSGTTAVTADAAEPAGSGSDTTGLATVPTAGGSPGTEVARRTGNCPSTVFGSTTTAKVENNLIVVDVTATDKDATETIRKRAEELLKEKMDGTGMHGTGQHDHKGSHGGGAGVCPIYVPANATATSTTIDNGIEIRITVNDGKVDDLKRIVDDRIVKADAWVKANIKPGDADNAGGVGGGSGQHGSNHSGEGDGKGKERDGLAGSGSGSAAAASGSAQ